MEKEKEKKFEDKMKELETIINDLENGNTDLDASIKKYTKAMELVKQCDEELKNAEAKISKIVNADGNLEDFKIAEN